MIANFYQVINGILEQVKTWEPRLTILPGDKQVKFRNSQNRNVKQILGHLIDSASNNTHRFIHMQYGNDPLQFPNYAINGNNDRWINIQNYQDENWEHMVQLWKFSNLHIVHVISNINEKKLQNKWQSDDNTFISLQDMVVDYLRHLILHMDEIKYLTDKTG